MMVVAGSTGKCLAQTLAEIGDVLLVTQIHLRFHDGVEVRADRLQRRCHLAGDDEVGFELDRYSLPQAAAAPCLGVDARFAFIARFGGLPRNEAEVAGAQSRAVTGVCVDCVGACAGFVARSEMGLGTPAIT